MAEGKGKDEIAVIEINEEFMKLNQQVKRNVERFQDDMMF